MITFTFTPNWKLHIVTAITKTCVKLKQQRNNEKNGRKADVVNGLNVYALHVYGTDYLYLWWTQALLYWWCFIFLSTNLQCKDWGMHFSFSIIIFTRHVATISIVLALRCIWIEEEACSVIILLIRCVLN